MLKPIIIVGASARAAAFSAYRAGYTPYWIDQFGDEDLKGQFQGQTVRVPGYPGGLIELMRRAPDAPFIFTGALENHADVLEKLSKHRTLLGNSKQTCLKVRDPSGLRKLFQRNDIPCPEIKTTAIDESTNRDWLVKPVRSAGGIGIEPYENQPIDDCHYLQEYIPGESFSAVFIGGRENCRLLGVTQQLVGLPEFHAREFGYCGSIGPVELTEPDSAQWRRIGEIVCDGLGVKGLFGVDAVKLGDRIIPIEVNPRYTASVEVLELAVGYRAIELHCDACSNQSITIEKRLPCWLIGKAYLFAPTDLTFKNLPATIHAEGETSFFSTADIPAHGAEIKKGHPILTIIVSGNSRAAISQTLRRTADTIYNYLW